MKKNRIYFGILLLVLAIIVIWSMLLMMHETKTVEKYSISVIVNDSNNDRWIAMREGLEQAAKDYNIELNYGSTGEIRRIDEELTLIQRELERGVDGIIVQMVDSDVDAEAMDRIASNTSVVLLETDVAPEGLYTYVGSNNVALGEALAETIQNSINLDGKKIGIITGNQNQISMQQRLTGCRNILETTNAEISWIMTGRSSTVDMELVHNQEVAPVDILITLGNAETEQAVDYFLTAEEKNDCLLYGVGSSEKAVYYLDKGMIQSLVVPNEFNMGYQSVVVLVEQLNLQEKYTEGYDVNYLRINRNNLYDERNQKILFPIVQ